jgi:DNA protecting protein DprA
MCDSLHANLLLQRLPDCGPASYWRLREAFGMPEAILRQASTSLAAFLKPSAVQALQDYQQHGEASQLGRLVVHDLAWLSEHPEVTVIGVDDADYPALLREIRRPPPLLYVLGDPACLNLPQIAIVGSRNPTPGGSDNAYQFARFLAGAGFTITSGLALGVDGAAHAGALAVEGRTVAVLGTGIDRIYPARHRRLAQDIVAQGGALVSEFPLDTRSNAGNFPQRNRIISGLSCGTLVVEAAVQSGSLITARLALEQNREVFAIPGSIHNPLARGCHKLIREGAKLVETGQDIVEELGALLGFQQVELRDHGAEAADPAVALEPAEASLLQAMGYDPVDVDTLAQRTSLDVGVIAAQLVGLEIKGVVSSMPGGYVRSSR